MSKFNNLKQNRINDQITAKKVFLIDEDGTKIGVISIFEAMDKARERGLDLVEVGKTEFPPVCKIMNYGKHCFMLKKNQVKSRKENKFKEKKEIQVRPNIEEHDFQVKLRHLIEFLKDGFKVNIVLKFKGRQIVHPSIGMNLLQKFAENAKEYGKVEVQPVIEGKRATMTMAPVIIAPINKDSKDKNKAEDVSVDVNSGNIDTGNMNIDIENINAENSGEK